MKKLLGMVCILLFSVYAYATMYVKKDDNGDIIYSNTPIPDKKPDTVTAKKPVIAEATEENMNTKATSPKNKP